MQTQRSGHLSTRRAIIKRASISLTDVTKFMSPGGKRIVRGWASTVRPDRVGDIVVPAGGKWTLPVPLLWQHSHKDPVGFVRSIEVRNNGLWIEAEFVEGFERADEVWRMVDAELIDAFSIGFRAIDPPEILATGGRRYGSWELLEVSCVCIPANADARISRARRPSDAAKLLATHRDGIPLMRAPARKDGAVKLITDAKPHAGVPLVSPRNAGDGAVKLRVKGDGSISLGRKPR